MLNFNFALFMLLMGGMHPIPAAHSRPQPTPSTKCIDTNPTGTYDDGYVEYEICLQATVCPQIFVKTDKCQTVRCNEAAEFDLTYDGMECEWKVLAPKCPGRRRMDEGDDDDEEDADDDEGDVDEGDNNDEDDVDEGDDDEGDDDEGDNNDDGDDDEDDEDDDDEDDDDDDDDEGDADEGDDDADNDAVALLDSKGSSNKNDLMTSAKDGNCTNVYCIAGLSAVVFILLAGISGCVLLIALAVFIYLKVFKKKNEKIANEEVPDISIEMNAEQNEEEQVAVTTTTA